MVFFCEIRQLADRDLAPLAEGRRNCSNEVMLERSARAELHANRDVLARIGNVQEAGSGAIQADLHGFADVGGGDAMQRGLVEVDLQVILRLRVFHIPVHVHHSRSGLKDVLDLFCERDLLLIVRTVNLCHQRL